MNNLQIVSVLLIVIVMLVARHYIRKSVLKKILRPLTLAFMGGFVFRSGLHMLLQDAMGLEAYIDFVRQSWVDTPLIIPALFTVLGIWSLFYAIRQQKFNFKVGDKCAGENDL